MKMKTNKVLSSLLAVFVGIVLFVPSSALAAAFGVSPPWIENENLKPGSNFVYVINLSAKDLGDDMLIKPTFEGAPEIMQWLTIQNMDNLVMTKGQEMLPMSVNVNIPADAKLGEYTGNLKISLSPKSGKTDNIAILLGSNIEVRLNIIDRDVTDYSVQSISVDPIVEGQPINLKLNVKNLGNTNVGSILTKASVVDMKTGAKVTSTSADVLAVPVYPHTMDDAELSMAAPDLKIGNYWLDVESFKGGKSIYTNRLYFAVEPSSINNAVQTAVEVAKEGWIKPSASEKSDGPNVDVKTSVTVRAPYTNTLILVVIGILLVLTGVVTKIYVTIRKKHH